ncbi:MAG: PCMD domain-containing protein [Muribaculaceae bacterium]|nr:PCMD domain-containing protein [Muribaculaceae bacterium]
MKKIKNIFVISAAVLTAGLLLNSCKSEAPFADEGEGVLRLNVDVDSRLTRAVEGEDELKANARIYISNEKGVLNRFIGTQSIPADGIPLRYGSYVAEAMAGDSVSASFTKKYYKGASDFYIGSSSPTTQVSVSCKIANVVASIDESTIDSGLMSDLKVVIGNSRGELTYASDSIMNYGYFMMPSGDTSLKYTVSGKNSKGNSFIKEGVINNVQPAYNYRLTFEYNTSGGNEGGAFLTISIVEEKLYEEEVTIKGKPAYSWLDNDPALDAQIIGLPGEFRDKTLRVYAYDGFRSLILKTEDEGIKSVLGGSEFELKGITEIGKAGLESKGITFIEGSPTENQYKYFITFSESFLNSLPARDTEYIMSVVAVDVNGKRGEQDVRIANTEEAIVYADPIIIDIEGFENDLTNVSARSVSIPVSITADNVEDPKLQYREVGESVWNSVAITQTRAVNTVVKITGLKPASEYEYRVVAGAEIDGKYEFESSVSTLVTESAFVIPNASMEEWQMNGKVLIPSADGNVTFWDTGNHGSSTMNKLVTNYSTSIFHSSTTSAELKSQFVGIGSIGKFAAGNLFVGSYDKTDGTDGELTFGREYDGSHPSALSIWVNYRPGIVDSKVKTHNYLNEGDSDKGQIYVALTNGPVKVKTKIKQLFNPDGDKNDDCEYTVVAYGQFTLESAYGDDGSLSNLRIPLEYTSAAKSVKPTHLIIVCSASKFGDYFEGGEGSLLYLDDFELVYE